ncbi:opacity protein-like surface antigen [Oxalobacteraceae bacterium GrIS 1.11]
MLKKIVFAIAIAYPTLASAQSNKELKAELEALKAHVKQLEAMINKVGAQAQQANSAAQQASTQAAQATAPVANENTVDAAEFNRIRIKTEGLEESIEANGFKSLKVSGYVDPTYMANRNRKTSSFVFFNNNSNVNGSGESFGYDNTFFGSGMFTLEKELEGGTKFKATLMPSKSAASGYNFGNLVHEASLSIPLGDLSTRLIAGQIPDWTGYEAIPSNQNKLITHNLLFDFSAANFYTGAGVEMVRGQWDTKILVGNLNRSRIDTARQETPGLFYRVDYAKGEFSGFGFSGIHAGFDDKVQFGRVDMVEADGYFTRGVWNFQGQLAYGRQGATPTNAYSTDKQSWVGLSMLASLKLTPRLESIARFDYINNKRNGGGVFGSAFGNDPKNPCLDTGGAPANCPDGRNGFGSGMVFDGANWVVLDPTSGSNRYALSLGLNYALMPGVNVKGEYRYDRSSANVFQTSDGQYRRDNHVVGVSTILSF